VIFGRKRKADPVDEPDDELTALRPEAQDTEDGEPADLVDAAPDASDDDMPAELREAEDDDEDEDEQPDDTEPTDWRADGPFDFEEVDLTADEVERLDLGSLILTPWQGMGLQLQVNEATQQVIAALAFWEQSGLELALLG
jgi:hypothetical protein